MNAGQASCLAGCYAGQDNCLTARSAGQCQPHNIGTPSTGCPNRRPLRPNDPATRPATNWHSQPAKPAALQIAAASVQRAPRAPITALPHPAKQSRHELLAPPPNTSGTHVGARKHHVQLPLSQAPVHKLHNLSELRVGPVLHVQLELFRRRGRTKSHHAGRAVPPVHLPVGLGHQVQFEHFQRELNSVHLSASEISTYINTQTWQSSALSTMRNVGKTQLSVNLAKGTSATAPLPLTVEVFPGDFTPRLPALRAQVLVECVLELLQTRPRDTKHKVDMPLHIL